MARTAPRGEGLRAATRRPGTKPRNLGAPVMRGLRGLSGAATAAFFHARQGRLHLAAVRRQDRPVARARRLCDLRAPPAKPVEDAGPLPHGVIVEPRPQRREGTSTGRPTPAGDSGTQPGSQAIKLRRRGLASRPQRPSLVAGSHERTHEGSRGGGGDGEARLAGGEAEGERDMGLAGPRVAEGGDGPSRGGGVGSPARAAGLPPVARRTPLMHRRHGREPSCAARGIRAGPPGRPPSRTAGPRASSGGCGVSHHGPEPVIRRAPMPRRRGPGPDRPGIIPP